MYILVRIFGNREQQKSHHKNLRPLISELLENKVIDRFVLTYHFRGTSKDCLYFCLDIPSCIEANLEAINSINGFEKVVSYLRNHEIRVSNYHDETSESQINYASKGSDAALKILSSPDVPHESHKFLERCLEYCLPLNENGIIPPSLHFLLNSLGFSDNEEKAVILSIVADKALHRLFNREGWNR